MRLDWLVTFRSVTFAQRGERLLRGKHIPCELRRTPRELSRRGCGYCLAIPGREIVPVVALLREWEVPFERVYAKGIAGEMEERIL